MQAVSLFDELEVTWGPSSDGRCVLDVEGADLPAENTLTKTLRLGQEIFLRQPSHVRLVKRIPSEAGLGGGSSDAAALLRAIAHVSPVSPAEMESVAAAVGMDVPFFLTGGRALGEHYGEQITALPDAPVEHYVVLKPPIGCSSAEMYANLDQSREGAAPSAPFGSDGAEPSRTSHVDRLYNDFESVAPCECIDLMERLQVHGARDAGLSGSGSAVFGRFVDERSAELAKEGIDGENLGDSWVVRSLTRAESLRIDFP